MRIPKGRKRAPIAEYSLVCGPAGSARRERRSATSARDTFPSLPGNDDCPQTGTTACMPIRPTSAGSGETSAAGDLATKRSGNDEAWRRFSLVRKQLLEPYGFLDAERSDMPFAWELADPQLYALAVLYRRPAYEAIQNVGEAEFHRAAVGQAQGQLRDGLPMRAEINVAGYLARKPEGAERA